MGCNCKVNNSFLAIVILVFAIWPAILPANASTWVVAIAAAIILIHSHACKACAVPMSGAKSKKKK